MQKDEFVRRFRFSIERTGNDRVPQVCVFYRLRTHSDVEGVGGMKATHQRPASAEELAMYGYITSTVSTKIQVLGSGDGDQS